MVLDVVGDVWFGGDIALQPALVIFGHTSYKAGNVSDGRHPAFEPGGHEVNPASLAHPDLKTGRICNVKILTGRMREEVGWLIIIIWSVAKMAQRHRLLTVSLQENTDIGYVPINATHALPFEVHNPNDATIHYSWKYTVFEVQPASGVLLPHSHNKFKIIFKPEEAVVVIGTIILEAEKEDPRTFKLSAIGKYSTLSCVNEPIEFHQTMVGKPVNKKVIIRNTSVVPGAFKITNEGSSQLKDNPFSITPASGQIPPKSSYEIDIKYMPQIAGLSYNTQLKVESTSGNELRLYCQAKSASFDVRLSSRSINFGEVKLENTCSRAITLQNNSDGDTDYQFFNDSGNIFSINDPKGTVPANSSRKVIILFDPKNTICYYERMFCIVRNHRLLYLDLLGTCYDLLIRPLPILQIHVDLFRRRVIEGRLSEIDFKYLESTLQMKINKKLQLLRDDKSLASLEQFDLPQITYQETQMALHKQLFLEGFDNRLLTQSMDFVDFGHCDTMTISSQQQLEITNNLHCRMTVYWILQKRENFTGDYLTPFQVYPESTTIKPGATARFQITFRPLKSQQFFFQHLQYFAVKDGGKINKRSLEEYEKKELKTLKPEMTLLKTLKVTQTIQAKVKDELESTEIMPTLHGGVKCVGNSFGIPSTAYIPIMSLHPSKNLLFAPCKVGESTYQTVQLVNNSDTLTYFKVGIDVTKVFRAFPKAGLIEGKSFQILIFEFSPKNYKSYSTNLLIHLNGSNGNPLQVQLNGTCPEPRLKLETNKLFFSKCFLGVYSKQTFQVQNLSRLPIIFSAEIPEKYKDEIFLNHDNKRLDSNEILNIEVCFVPEQKRQYKVKIPIRITEEPPMQVVGYFKPGSANPDNSSVFPTPKSEEYFVEIFGEGGDGSLALEMQEIDFGVVKVLEQKKMQVKLKNLSDCTFYIELSLKSNPKEVSHSDIQSSFHLDFTEATLVAKGETLIGVTFTPNDVKDFDVQLVASAREQLPKSLKLPPKNIHVAKCSLKIKAQGSYPLLQIVDIRNDCLSVTALWESFQLSKMNNELSTNLNQDEKKYLNIETLPFAESQALQKRLNAFNWNFGYLSARNSSKPRKILLTIKNFGGIELDYNFKFPFDNEIKKEIWADPGEPTKEEAYQKAIIDKNIFKVHPKADRLQPGEVKDIEFTYTPASIQNDKNSNEKHSLNVVLEIKNGKSLVLNLQGVTLGPQEGLLVVKKNFYHLPDTPIGMIVPLKFPIELQNVGSAKISYRAVANYDDNEFPEVFMIENPNGDLMLSEKGYLYTLFKPLEKKTYHFIILVHVINSSNLCTQVVEIQLKGKGFEKPLSSPQTHAKSVEEIPGQRSLMSDVGSKVFFSLEEIDFGSLRAKETTYRMIILYNLSRTSSLSYDFPMQNLPESKSTFTCGDTFTIESSSGEIGPNDFAEIKLTITAAQNPSFYEGEIECNIFWNNKIDSSLDDEHERVDVNFDKEILFLRINKAPVMLPVYNDIPPEFSEDQSLLESLFSNIIQSTLNHPSLIQDFDGVQDLPLTVVDLIPDDQGVDITKVDNSLDNTIQPGPNLNHSNYKVIFLNQEFIELTNIIMENTFFNILQETTRKENDLLRITKKFVTSTPSPVDEE